MSEKTLRVYFEGRVQGVGFRYSTREIAKGFDVLGTVKNLPDGRVELIVSGECNEIDDFIQEISKESELAHHISDVKLEEIAALSDLRGFNIIK